VVVVSYFTVRSHISSIQRMEKLARLSNKHIGAHKFVFFFEAEYS